MSKSEEHNKYSSALHLNIRNWPVLLRLQDQLFDKSPEIPRRSSVKYAIIGNIIDFNPIHALMPEDIGSYFWKLEEEDLGIEYSGSLQYYLSGSKKAASYSKLLYKTKY